MAQSALWLLLVVVLSLIEAVTFGLFTIWFAIGGVAAMFTALLGGPVWLQILLFVLVSTLMLIFTKPIVQKKLKAKGSRTNYDRIIDQEGVVIVDVDMVGGTGQVKAIGQIWSAKSGDGTDIKEGRRVKITAVEGVKVIVTPIKEEL